MNTEQLKKTLFDYECMRKTFIEITAINALPKELPSTYPQLYVVNTDPLLNPGKHWVCVIFFNRHKSEYFDSLGRPPRFYGESLQTFITRNSRESTFIQRRLQSKTSSLCGFYVIFFAVMRICFRMSIEDVFSVFTSEDPDQNDRFISMYFYPINI